MPRDSTFATGETVKVVVPAAAVVTGSPLVVQVGSDQFTVPADESVAVTSVDPTGWPPQVGDLWRAGVPARTFFAVYDPSTSSGLRMMPADGGAGITPNVMKRDQRPSVLVYRGS